ncbi:S8 family serine peptidase [Stackebrandtia soli]|uniref:S8 family serine peptidase n=1 Tax=Stackebrandtia soli TaxID=1892856 RepID=UPI0039EB42A2
MNLKHRMLGGRRRRTITAGAVVTATALGVALVVGPWAWSEPTPAGPPGSGDLQTITLITGDQVTVNTKDDRQSPRIRRGEGRENITFTSTRFNGDLVVVPSDADALLRSGKLDKRLFNVSDLIDDGYGNAERATIPLLTQTSDVTASVADDAGAKVTSKLPSLGIAATRQPKNSTGELWASMTTTDEATKLSGGVSRVWLDGKRELLLDHSVGQIGAPSAWDAGFTGDGITVAVLDTGIDADHPDLADQITAMENFTGDEMVDDVGHGTHVASTIAGIGAKSDGLYKGVAPDADLIIGKVCTNSGCDESSILAGMEWAARQDATIANLSLGGTDSPEMDPLEQAVEDLTAEYDTLFVISAGNDGGDGTVSSPSTAPSALSVGAVDDNDALADFSSRGPRSGDHGVKPDITAPGVDIIAAKANGSNMGDSPVEGYLTASGTSMAAPHVAGTAALLAQQHPDWSAARLKAAIMASAEPNGELTAFEQGAGRVNVTQAINQEAYPEPSSVSGFVKWPNQDSAPATETITVHNPGDTALALDLTVTSTAPAGMFTTNVSTVDVPAGGSGTFTVTTDPSVADGAGSYSAHVTAVDGLTSIVVPVGSYVESESYDVDVSALGLDGSATTATISLYQLGGGDEHHADVSPEGSTVRVPAGEYQLDVAIPATNGDLAWLRYPSLTVSEDRELVADARETKRTTVTVPNSRAKATSGTIVAIRGINEEWFNMTMIDTPDVGTVRTAQIGEDAAGVTRVLVLGSWSTPTSSTGANGTGKIPASYNLAFTGEGFPTGFTREVTKSELVKVVADYRTIPADTVREKYWFTDLPTGDGVAVRQEVGAESTRHEYLNVIPDMQWSADITTLDAETRKYLAYQITPGIDRKAGETYRETWTAAVLAPCDGSVYRNNDTLYAIVYMQCDPVTGRFGNFSQGSVARLYFGDELVGESDVVKADIFESTESGTFRLEIDAVAPLDTSAQISSTWTFESEAVEEENTLLPTVRLDAKGLDATNTAADETTVIDFTVEAGPDPIETEELLIERSVDGGKTWTEVAVDGGSFTVDNPADGDVSLRVSGTADNGVAFEHTIMEAYHVA